MRRILRLFVSNCRNQKKSPLKLDGNQILLFFSLEYPAFSRNFRLGCRTCAIFPY